MRKEEKHAAIEGQTPRAREANLGRTASREDNPMSMIIRSIVGADSISTLGVAYRIVWRWHFYAGLFCLPFIVMLSLSGSVYLFKPQIDAFLDRDYDDLRLVNAPKTLDEQVAAAMAAVPNARLKGAILRNDSADAARVHLMDATGRDIRVLVRPDTLEIMKVEAEKSRLTSIMHDLHGELLIGEPGAIAVELAGAWAIVMLITGLYLWWPRSNTGFGGVLYPRFGEGRRFYRDLHAVIGIWMSIFALFFLISALPWTKVWGGAFQKIRGVPSWQALNQVREVKQDWTTGPASEQAKRLSEFRVAVPSNQEVSDEHAEHRGYARNAPASGHDLENVRIQGFDRVAAIVRPLGLADPILIAPPSPHKRNWVVRSETQNRPQQVKLEFDPTTLALVKREGFEDKALIDRVVAIGVAAHEGQLFGWLNQALGLSVALGYLTTVTTALIMWLRRRPRGVLGAPPPPLQAPRLAPLIVVLVVALGVFLPTLGCSLLVVLATERVLCRFAPRAALWLGMRPYIRRSEFDKAAA